MRLNEFQINDETKKKELVLQVSLALKETGFDVAPFMDYVDDFVTNNFELLVGQIKNSSKDVISDNFKDFVKRELDATLHESFASKIIIESFSRSK